MEVKVRLRGFCPFSLGGVIACLYPNGDDAGKKKKRMA